MSRRIAVSPALADVIEGLCLAAFGAAIAHVVASGSYTSLATPRSKPYLICAAALLFMLSAAACGGLFHASARSAGRWLAALVIPALLITVPFRPSAQSTGFDPYAGGRPIAIPGDVYGQDGAAHLHGLDARHHAIRVRDDEFGSWFEHIDHNPDAYVGYRIHMTGYVDHSSTFGSDEFMLSRQFMSCCVLDMTPFGFIAKGSKAAELKEHQWVELTADITQGSYGAPCHERQSVMLRIRSVSPASKAPSGYFYWQ